MSPERSQAYCRVIQTLADLGPARLFMDEQERVRYAADTLIFSTDLGEDTAARLAIEDLSMLCRDLVDSGRWEDITATRLADDVRQCGPEELIELKAA